MDQPPSNLPTWQTVTRLERSPNRAPIRLESVYNLSKSDSKPVGTEDYIIRQFDPTSIPTVSRPYGLGSITGKTYTTNHKEGEEDMCTYISTTISQQTDTSVNVLHDRQGFGVRPTCEYDPYEGSEKTGWFH